MNAPAPAISAEDTAPSDTVKLAAILAAGEVLHLPAHVTHARRGAIRHAFAYDVDHVLMAPDIARGPWLLSRNRFNLAAVHDRDHGGERGSGTGTAWVWQQLRAAGLSQRPGLVLALLTQPRFAGFWFTPISLWIVLDGADTLAVIAEVNNTFGHRHSYLCHLAGFAPITAQDVIVAQKVFHVSPFQDIAGHYEFRFDIRAERIAIRIGQIDGTEGLIAAMTGPLIPLTSRRILRASLRRPGGALRTLALIYWNALRLKLLGVRYRPAPPPPEEEISR